MPEFKLEGREMRIYTVKEGKGYGYIYLHKEHVGEKVAIIFDPKLNEGEGKDV